MEINRCAARYFYENLNAKTPEAATGPPLLEEKRGLSDAAIRRFGLGYAPEDFGGLLHYLKRRGFSEEELETSGLVKRSAKGNLYDIFRHRVMVPIIDVRGAIIAFGGRVLDDCPATQEVLADIVAAVDGRAKILVDGGIRTGSDVFKALALGAPYISAVGLCRSSMAAAMSAKKIGDLIEAGKVPPELARFGTTKEELFSDLPELRGLYGSAADGFSTGGRRGYIPT